MSKFIIKVYYPIVYSEYDPSNVKEAIRILGRNESMSSSSARNVAADLSEQLNSSHFEFSFDKGYWRQFGFGIVVVYNSDLRRVGGFDVSIVGWGKEDVDLYEKFIASNLTVFRSVDVGLTHVFHKIECDPKLPDEQMVMCLGSKGTSIASQRVLANLVYENREALLQDLRV